MIKRTLSVFFIVIPFLLIASETGKGLTCRVPEPDNQQVIGIARPYLPPARTTTQAGSGGSNLRDWEMVDSLAINTFIRAGSNLAVGYNGIDHTLEVVTNLGTLTEAAQAALRKAPQWLRPDLENVFRLLSDPVQNLWAETVLNCVHPCIDEVAYAIAHSSPVFLGSELASPELFLENAWLMYEHDQELNYVEIVDYGSPLNDEDYWSTTRYWKLDEAGEMVQSEVPRDIYYMYLVHPKNTDEIPAYIDPDIIESNTSHQNNIVGPNDGYFWRDYLYNFNDPGYPKLKYYLQEASVVWNSGSPDMSTAIGAINTWLSQSLEFTSNNERPHQPVRIYKKHMGRCGEHADMRSAAARAALIPCTSILTISTDHTWNEFWDDRWVHWDGAVDNPLLYENGWGKTHASVFEIRSDGWLSPVSDVYSAGSAEIIIYVLDQNEQPVDGARIVLGASINNVIRFDNAGFTDNQGKYVFIVGEGIHYYAQMTSAVGDVSGYLSVVENAEDGQVYTCALEAPGSMPVSQHSEISVPEDDETDFRLVVDFTVPEQVIRGLIVMDDLDDTEFFATFPEGELNFFLADLVEYYSYEAGNPFSAFYPLLNVAAGNIEFDLPSPMMGYWYAFFDNSLKVSNPQYITGHAALYSYDGAGGTSTISGQVISSADQSPLPGAVVRAGINEAITDDQGNYSLEVFPNYYHLNCTASGFLTEYDLNVDASPAGNYYLDISLTEIPYGVQNVSAEQNTDSSVTITWDPPGRQEVSNQSLMVNLDNDFRELEGYNLYLGEAGTELNFEYWFLLAGGLTGHQYIDPTLPFLPQGIYRYGVEAVYSNSNPAPVSFSNPVFNNLLVSVDITVATNSGEDPQGALVTLSNQESTNSIYAYSAILPEGGSIHFDQVLKGTYNLSVYLANFELYLQEDIVIEADADLELVLFEAISAIYGLGVVDYLLSWEKVPADRSFQHYNVYLDDLNEPLIQVTGNSYQFTGVDSGVHLAGVSAEYSTGGSAISLLEFSDGHSLNTGLIGYYPLEGNAQDQSGNDLHGVLNGDISFPVGEVAGQCAMFDSDGEYINIEGIFPQAAEDFSVSWWLFPDNCFNWNQQMRSTQGWGGFLFHTTDFHEIYVGTDVSSRLTPADFWEGLTAEDWNFFTFTYENGRGRLFKNGFELGARDAMNPPAAWNGFLIGSSDQNTIKGLIDEVRLWGRAVGISEVQELYVGNVPGWGILQGQVVDTAQDPIAAALITAGMFQTVTDAAGYYSLDLAATRYRVSCQVGAFDVQYADSIYINEGEATTLDFLYNFTPAQDEIVPPAAAGIINVYPNPFNPSVTIQYQLPADCPDAGLTIYNVRGQLIRSYPFDPSTHESVGSRIFTINSITWDGRDNAGRRVGSGIYLVRLQGVGNNPPRKIMLLK